MKEIRLSRQMVTLVDDADYEELSAFKWYAHSAPGGKFYAAHKVKRGSKWTVEYMHRRIIRPAPHLDVDHCNGESLDNRRSNLKACSRAENLRNSRLYLTGGAYFDRHTGKWFARTSINGKNVFLGRFRSRVEAMERVWEARLKAFGVDTKMGTGAADSSFQEGISH